MTDEFPFDRGYCYTCGHVRVGEDLEACRNDEEHPTKISAFVDYPRAPVPTPPIPPNEDHAPEHPGLDPVERNLVLACPRCGTGCFGERLEDGSLWSYGHSIPRVIGWCPALPILEQATMEAYT